MPLTVLLRWSHLKEVTKSLSAVSAELQKERRWVSSLWLHFSLLQLSGCTSHICHCSPENLTLPVTVFQLCFDYQLDSAEGQHKTACHCGAPECRKWINWGEQKTTNLNTFLATKWVCYDLCTDGFIKMEKLREGMWRGCDLCHMCEALLCKVPLSACMYLCVRCTWGAESTSEWESTVQGAALLLMKGRPFCFILFMYTVWVNVDITEWGMYSNEYCEGKY